MNKPSKTLTVSECKIQASLLLKALESADKNKAEHAAKRFQRTEEFSHSALNAIINNTEIKRKHALTVIAKEKGFTSWNDLKCQLPFIIGGYLNKWFPNYDEAKAHQRIAGGFLLPYRNQFFICESTYIQQLGFDPEDPDWKLINYDWAKPQDKTAWQRLYKQWMKIQGGSHE